MVAYIYASKQHPNNDGSIVVDDCVGGTLGRELSTNHAGINGRDNNIDEDGSNAVDGMCYIKLTWYFFHLRN